MKYNIRHIEKSLLCCSVGDCDHCSYNYKHPDHCRSSLCDDAHYVLAQFEINDKTTKEEETEPYKIYINACDPVNKEFIGYRCNKCNADINLFLNHYCPNCGRKINWEAIKNENSKI